MNEDTYRIGLRLADVFMAHYGDHIHASILAVDELQTLKNGFKLFGVAYLSETPSNIAECTKNKDVVPLMVDMAVKGYAVIS